jgi:hypothetical protein
MKVRRGILVATLIAFLAIEAILLTQLGSIDHAMAVLREPVVLVMLTDFTFLTAIVFFWMVADAKKRGENGWLWLPPIILVPTVALLAFLLRRPQEERG